LGAELTDSFLKPLFFFMRDLVFVVPVCILALAGRFIKKKVDIGLGPEPLINNVHHKKALERHGYSARTFVRQVYYITDLFDVRADRLIRPPLSYWIRDYYLFFHVVFSYRCLYIYFNGGPLGFTSFLWRLEPLLLRLARVKVVVMPYGSDVQEMSRSPNLLFKDAISTDYPDLRLRRKRVAAKIDLWTRYADHVISGCEWVDYMCHWDTLMVAHFSIDTEMWQPIAERPARADTPLRVLHAPNHRAIKGTQYLIEAVKELKEAGVDIELVILERMPNEEVKRVMATVDIVADQLIVGWYAMFALEAMAMGKPVICYIRKDLEELYITRGLLSPGELPVINCTPLTVQQKLRDLASDRSVLDEIGQHSRAYALKLHSTEAVGRVFDSINRSIGLRANPAREG
jgi:glycosyltransferase involved in cell wall biosynthesis